MKRNEEDEQIALFEYAGLQKAPEWSLLFHLANGGYRSKRTGARMKRLGVRAGLPDCFLPCTRDGFHGLWIEMKSHKGKTTVTQEVWHDNLRKEGYMIEVHHSADSAIDTIKNYISPNGSD